MERTTAKHNPNKPVFSKGKPSTNHHVEPQPSQGDPRRHADERGPGGPKKTIKRGGGRSNKGQSPWNLHVKKTMNENKGKSLGEVLKMASRTYKKGPSVGPARTKRRPARSKRRKKSKSKKRKSKRSGWF